MLSRARLPSFCRPIFAHCSIGWLRNCQVSRFCLILEKKNCWCARIAIPAQTILRGNPDNFHKNFGAFTAFFGSSRLTSDGEQWRKLQKISQPLIAGVEAAEIVRETKHHYTEAASRILDAARNCPVLAIDNFIDHAAASVVMKTVLGLDISALPSSFYANLRIVLAYCGKSSVNIYDPSRHVDHAEKADAERAFGEARATINALIAEGRSASRGANPSLEAFYSAFPSDSDMFGEFCTLLFAGYDTTSSTLCWALMLLANRPSLQEQLRSEAQEAGEGKEGLSVKLQNDDGAYQ